MCICHPGYIPINGTHCEPAPCEFPIWPSGKLEVVKLGLKGKNNTEGAQFRYVCDEGVLNPDTMGCPLATCKNGTFVPSDLPTCMRPNPDSAQLFFSFFEACKKFNSWFLAFLSFEKRKKEVMFLCFFFSL